MAEKIVAMCLPDFQETGKLYDCEKGRLLSDAAAGVRRVTSSPGISESPRP